MTPLRRRRTEDLILHNLPPKTSRRDVKWVADFAQHFHTSPEHLGSEHVRSFLLHLIQERKVSWNIHKEARLALQFFYRVTLGREEVVEKVAHPKAKTLPVVLSRDGMAPPRRAAESQAPRGADDRLRRRPAALRDRTPPRRGH